MRVSKDSNFSTLATDAKQFEEALVQISSLYSEGISGANSLIGEVFFGTWVDSLSVKIEDFFNNAIIKSIDTIDSDIQSGSFSVLKQTVTSLKEELSKCDTYKKSIDSKKESLEGVSATVSKLKNPDWRLSYQGGTGGTNEKIDVPNPDYVAIETEIAGLEQQLDAYIANSNVLFEKLESIKFNDGSVVATTTNPIIFVEDTSTSSTRQIDENRFVTTTTTSYTDGGTEEVNETYYDYDRDGTPDDDMTLKVETTTSGISAGKQQDRADDALYDTGVKVVIDSDEDGVNYDEKGNIVTNMEDVDTISNNEVTEPLNVNSPNNANTSTETNYGAVTSSDSSSSGAISHTTTYYDENQVVEGTREDYSIKYGLTNKGNEGIVTYKDDSGASFDCSLTYDEDTHLCTETVVENGKETTNTYYYYAQTYRIQTETGTYEVTINPSTRAGQLCLRETISSAISDKTDYSRISSDLCNECLFSDEPVASEAAKVVVTPIGGEYYDSSEGKNVSYGI